MEFKDFFSGHADEYLKYRPTYPDLLYQYLSSQAKEHALAWDCGTGNGQVAIKLADYFEKVVATDPSKNQLLQAPSHPKVKYSQTLAEQSELPDKSIDLVTAAQAFHWFNQESFFKEVYRVAKPGAVIALWCYEKIVVTPEVDKLIDHLYLDILENYWSEERQLVNTGYKNISFPFKEIIPPKFQMVTNWSLDHLLGYFKTWSATKKFIQKNNYDPVERMRNEFEKVWGNLLLREARWEIYLRIGMI